MDYLTQYYKNLAEQLQAKANYLQNLLNETSSGYPGDKVTPVKFSREEREAINAKELARINAERKARGEEPFETFKDLEVHNIQTNQARRAAREAETRARIEAWAQSPEGQAHIARHTSNS
jgi:hypothetical protein